MTQSTFDDATMTWNAPDLILITTDGGETTKLWPVAGLERSEGFAEDEREWSAWIEYRLNGEIVHRSARTHVKQGVFGAGACENFL